MLQLNLQSNKNLQKKALILMPEAANQMDLVPNTNRGTRTLMASILLSGFTEKPKAKFKALNPIVNKIFND